MGSDQPEHKRCLGCGYILDHLPEQRCPECGRAFDADDASTFAGPHTRTDAALAVGVALLGGALMGFGAIAAMVGGLGFVLACLTFPVGCGLNLLVFVHSAGSFLRTPHGLRDRKLWLVALVISLVFVAGCCGFLKVVHVTP